MRTVLDCLSTLYLQLRDASLSPPNNANPELQELGKIDSAQLKALRLSTLARPVEALPNLPALHDHLFRLATQDLELSSDAHVLV